MTPDCRIIVFAKAPVPGQVKTRLAGAIGETRAARLASRMLAETVWHAIEAGVGEVELCCAPDSTHADFVALQARHALTLTVQGEGDLGARMHRALAGALTQYKRVLLIGTDAPQLDASVLRAAAARLTTQPVVFVPASDGGYVLVGLTRAMPALFEEIEWSTPRVMAQSRARLAASGISVDALPMLPDVDEPADLIHVPDDWWQ